MPLEPLVRPCDSYSAVRRTVICGNQLKFQRETGKLIGSTYFARRMQVWRAVAVVDPDDRRVHVWEVATCNAKPCNTGITTAVPSLQASVLTGRRIKEGWEGAHEVP